MEAGSGRLLGDWKINSQAVRVYEIRYAQPGSYGVRIDYKPKRSDQYKVYGMLSANMPNVTLEPGEFVVNCHQDQMKHHWQDLMGFPEFEDTKKTVPHIQNNRVFLCPVWRFMSHDCMPEGGGVREQGCVPHTGIVESLYLEIKDLVKSEPTDYEIAELLIGLKAADAGIVHERSILSDPTAAEQRNENNNTDNTNEAIPLD
ncbi:uncharacterized protein LOC116613013 [Nematostella vectensis]|uniref:uncharacterized protein LOC116613013 n=1 Tax=Nematostella vectensis TaxID=45351 RepID=UPI00138FCFCE|nr:uncharacterized protein LOC116613013 [Nematostella vectensis]